MEPFYTVCSVSVSGVQYSYGRCPHVDIPPRARSHISEVDSWLRGMQVLKCRDASLLAPIAVVQRIELNSATLVASKVPA
jgi:hypothetical protein